MKKYRFVYNNGYTDNAKFECDADAMMKARADLELMRTISENYKQIAVWRKNEDGRTWRHVVTYC